MFFLINAGLVLGQRDKKKKSVNSATTESALREAEFFFTEGEKHFILEDYTKALLYYQRAAELNPFNATIHYKIADVFTKTRKEDDLIKAATSIEASMKLDPSNKYFYLLASNIYASLGQFSNAQKSLETMMREVPGTDEYLYELAVLYIYDKKTQAAIDIYNQIESLFGVTEVSSQQKQSLYTDLGKIDLAIAESEKLIEAFPDEEEFVLGFAEFLSRQNQRPRAIEVLQNHIAQHPESGSAKMLLAGIYRDNGQEKEARILVLGSIENPELEIGSKVLMIATYLNQFSQEKENNSNDAELQLFLESALNKLMEQHPADPNVYILSGDFMLSLGKDREAGQNYFKAIKNGSTSFDAWQNLLVLESKQNQFDSLINHSEMGLELFPNQALIYYFNGYGHFRKKHYKEAAIALEQAKKLSVSNLKTISEINGMLGDAYNGSKEYAKSDQVYDEALAYNPNDEIVLNNYSYYLALRKESLDKAERMSTLLVKNNPNNPTYLDTHAWVLFTREKYKEARKTIEKAIAIGGNSAVYFEHYGDILFKLGEVDEAVNKWRQAKILDSKNELIDKKITNRKL